ncbi:DNA repair exonuclease SbcCD nuclease subunit [Anaeroplasma bactoclasticum]|jgi:DNA repair exonuclease SbcCD nuclease subunit|uniref:DNA repair exonuclease SbcCD nuclease subunit n=1 Tax=Anaeroplasma bactoclasticum TaxID=2088 RepID=A0A397RIL6_9MOLU|nr:metallophosphoesterase [Anaeroplasma bactoclasticum]RIA73953.1 DNA repair exonuclease SbcCD nuclease subunit [Anaeroplasma bactoclasticum]
MRIIHTADLHLDSRLETNLDPVKAKERKRELLLSFDNLINYAKNNLVDAILISGDLFDRPKISAKTREYIIGLIEEAKELQFFLIYGNHDINMFSEHPIGLPSNLHIFQDRWETISLPEVDITGISGESISPALYDHLVLNRNKLNIVMLHGDITNLNSIPLSMLKERSIDYLALGHLHKYQKGKLDDRGVWVYPGCLEGRGFDEEGPKGFMLLEIAEGKISSKFIPFSKRILHDIKVDITNCDSWLEIRKNVNLKLTDVPQSDMVRVRLIGNYDLSLIKQNELLEQSLNQQYYFAKVSDESRLRINPKDYENDISLKGEFIRNVLSSKLSEDDKIRVIEYGIKALMKEEI